jgi:hypothetical protein
MVDDPGFHHVLDKNIRRGTAMCVRRQDGAGLRGGILFNVRPPVCRISWLVVAQSDRGIGVSRALVTEAEQRLDSTGLAEVITSAKTTPPRRPAGPESSTNGLLSLQASPPMLARTAHHASGIGSVSIVDPQHARPIPSTALTRSGSATEPRVTKHGCPDSEIGLVVLVVLVVLVSCLSMGRPAWTPTTIRER